MEAARQPSPSGSPEALERRRAPREASPGSVTVHVQGARVEGRIDNLSGAGVLFFGEDPLRVRVVITTAEGTIQHREGRLVRVERMSATTSGFAVEFDRD